MINYWLDIFLEPKKTIREIIEDPNPYYGFIFLMFAFGFNMVSSVFTFDPTSLPAELPFDFSKLVLIAAVAAFPLALLVSYATAWSSVIVAKWFGKEIGFQQALLLVLWGGYVQFIPDLWSLIGAKIANLGAAGGIFHLFITVFFTMIWLVGMLYGVYLGMVFFKEIFDFDWWKVLNYLGVVGIVGAAVLLIPAIIIGVAVFSFLGGFHMFDGTAT